MYFIVKDILWCCVIQLKIVLIVVILEKYVQLKTFFLFISGTKKLTISQYYWCMFICCMTVLNWFEIHTSSNSSSIMCDVANYLQIHILKQANYSEFCSTLNETVKQTKTEMLGCKDSSQMVFLFESEIQSKRQERKRRSTANPAYSGLFEPEVCLPVIIPLNNHFILGLFICKHLVSCFSAQTTRIQLPEQWHVSVGER